MELLVILFCTGFGVYVPSSRGSERIGGLVTKMNRQLRVKNNPRLESETSREFVIVLGEYIKNIPRKNKENMEDVNM